MNNRNEVIARFKQGGEGYPLFLPNFTLWHDWHRNRGSLPSSWADYSLPELAREFGCPAWTPVQPWRIDTPGVKIQKKETENKRIISYETGSATLAEARKITGQNITLWGGIPQNYLMNVYDDKKFEAEVRQAIEEANGDKRMILGVADRVPVEADIGRLAKIQNLLNKEG